MNISASIVIVNLDVEWRACFYRNCFSLFHVRAF